MKVKDLRRQLEQIPDDAGVFVSFHGLFFDYATPAPTRRYIHVPEFGEEERKAIAEPNRRWDGQTIHD